MLCFLCVVPLNILRLVVTCKVEKPRKKRKVKEEGEKKKKGERKNRPQTKALFGEAGRRAISPFGNNHFFQASPS